MTTRQYARLVSEWIAGIGLDPHVFATHSLRRTKATLIYRRTGNLRAVQLLLGHKKIESTVRYLGMEVDDALAIAEPIVERDRHVRFDLRRWEEGLETACGLWLIASPFIFGYADAGTLRYWHFVLGAAVVLLAVLELRQDWILSCAELRHHSAR